MTFVASAVRTGHAVAGVELPQRGALSGTLDSIVFPWSLGDGKDDRRGGPARAGGFRAQAGPPPAYLVRRAEKHTRSAEIAASRLLKRGSTDILLASLLGVGSLLFVGSLVGPRLQIAHHAHDMRVKLEQVMAAVKPLQRQVEQDWALTRSIPQRPDYGAVRTHQAFALVGGVDLNPRNGRVRVDLGNAVPELQGRSLLLAPAVDAWQEVRWLCVPIDIPTAYVPAACS